MESKKQIVKTCEFCTKKSKGVVVPMSYKSISKYTEHCRKEKHLVNAGLLKMNNCHACKISFYSAEKEAAHYLKPTHIKNQAKFD